MEQKKTLWIIAAVGIFLLVVIGVGMLMFPSSSKTTATVTNITPVEKNINNGWSSPTGITENKSDLPTEVKDLVVLSENTTVYDFNAQGSTTIDLNTLKNEMLPETQVQETESTVTVDVTKVDEPKVEVAETKPVSAVQAEAQEKANSVKQPQTTTVATVKPATTTTTTTTSKPAATTSTTTSKTTAKTTTTTTKTTTTATATKPTTTTQKAVTRYWVQVASYSNKKTAENARTILSDSKIASDIFTYEDASGKLFYRVRVGPYTTKSEAEYWMAKITQIKDFASAGSYVTSTTNK